MTKPKLLANLPVKDLTVDTDYLGIIDKGDLIKSFLIGNKDQFDEIKMFSLYGEWGSGKSSLMKYIQKELSHDFNTFFFESWEFEKDNNLAMSLLEYMATKDVDVEEGICSDLLKYGGRILKGLGKSIKFNLIDLIEFDTSELIKELVIDEKLSFFKALEKFKIEFKKFEDKITVQGKPKNNIVFIDDLDRCEPEQVLNLLSAIKLFFTYGNKTVFICGIDKMAVEQAVKTKYGKILKANEYLEKIFDISFSMPEHEDMLKLINYYFDSTAYDLSKDIKGIDIRINEFFNYLQFTNPRRVKKVLNKYQYLRNLKDFSLPVKFRNFPNIDLKFNGIENNFFETILTIYLIILHEFYPDYFNNFLNFDLNKKNYFKDTSSNNVLSESRREEYNSEIINILKRSYSDCKFDDVSFNENIDKYFMICIFPSETKLFKIEFLSEDRFVSEIIIEENKIQVLFYKFIMYNWHLVSSSKNYSKSSFESIKKLIKDAL